MDQDFDATAGSFDRRRIAALVVVTAFVVGLLYLVADRIVEDVLEIESFTGQLAEVAVMALITSILLWAGVLRPLHHEITERATLVRRHQETISKGVELQQFEGRLHRALEMATTEPMTYGIVEKALRDNDDDVSAVLMLADASEAHLVRVVGSVADEVGCRVDEPQQCPAIRRSQTMRFESNHAIDACPHLGDSSSRRCSAVCVPMSVGGRSIGVLHAVSHDTSVLDGEIDRRLESVATQSGSRIGMLRVMSTTAVQAATDPLTGLRNRRSFEDEMVNAMASGKPVALAMLDLDHFKRLNDEQGHEAGDNALRLFARVLRSAFRENEIIARYGGEEFVVAFPGCDLGNAASAIERLRHSLLVELAGTALPGFTFSCGLTDTNHADTLTELYRRADIALFRAKDAGRNRTQTDAAQLYPDAPTTEQVGGSVDVIGTARPVDEDLSRAT